jgi:WD40 repeat protein
VRRSGAWDTAFQLGFETNRIYPSPATFSPDSSVLALAASRREVRLYRSDNWVHFATLPLRSEETLEWLSFTPDGSRLVATSQTAIHIWDLGRIQAKWSALGLFSMIESRSTK